MREDRTKSFMEHMTTVFVRGGCTRRVTGAGAGRLPATRRRPRPTVRQTTVRNARGLIFGHAVEEWRVFCCGNVCCVMVDVVSVMDDDGE